MVLAAGLGTRLRPLTAVCPKALLPVRGRRLVEVTLEALVEVGCEAVAINLHHLGSDIEESLGDRFEGMPIVYSREQEILGTLGALVHLREFLSGASTVLLVNGDSLCRWPFHGLLERHWTNGAEATLLLSETADSTTFGGVGINDDGRVTSFPGAPAFSAVDRRLVFAGAHAFSPDLLTATEPGFSSIIPELYLPLLEAGRHLDSHTTAVEWHDVGTPLRYLDAVRSWRSEDLGGLDPALGESWIHGTAEVAEGAEVAGSVVEGGAVVGDLASIASSLVMTGARVGSGSRLSRTIVGPRVVLAPGSSFAASLVTAPAPGEGSSEVVVTPLR